MKTVVITGSARGFGFSMLELFYKKGYNVVICDINEKMIEEAKKKLESLELENLVLAYRCDVTNEEHVKNLIKAVLKKVDTIDIWINNAGVNQPSKYIWELDEVTIDRVIDIDLKGSIISSKCILKTMLKQGFGQIYNVEGHGSNDAKITGLTLYGTAKRGLTYFTESLGKEIDEINKRTKSKICIGKITPGIMITNFLNKALGDGEKIELDEKTKNIYNILGDYPETIAKYMVKRIARNKRNNVKFTWLTTKRAMFRFIKSLFGKKNNYFE